MSGPEDLAAEIDGPDSAAFVSLHVGRTWAAVSMMRERAERLRGVTRLHRPTVGDPLIVVVVDELASLTAYVSDRGGAGPA